jgi:hypothetical protein
VKNIIIIISSTVFSHFCLCGSNSTTGARLPATTAENRGSSELYRSFARTGTGVEGRGDYLMNDGIIGRSWIIPIPSL